jgi:SAM-dependent methyltransferase
VGAAALLRLIEAEGDVVAGTYRFKREPEEYMGALLPDINGRPQVRDDGCVKAHSIPAGFLKITKNGVNRFMIEYPELCYGDRFSLAVDLFNHGAHEGRWYGEDYAFARRWNAKCGQIWTIPDINLTHWDGDRPYPGNFHQYLLRQDGGSESANPQQVTEWETKLNLQAAQGSSPHEAPARRLRWIRAPRVPGEPRLQGSAARHRPRDEAGHRREPRRPGRHRQFDAIFSSHVVEHLYPHEVSVALAELYRVTAPGGFAMVIVPDLEGVPATDDVLFECSIGPLSGLDLIYGCRYDLERSPYMAHHSGFVSRTLEDAMKAAGFEVVTMKRLPEYNLMAVGQKAKGN